MSAGAFANYEEHVINSDPGNWVLQGALSESWTKTRQYRDFFAIWSPATVALRNSPSGAHFGSPCLVSLHETDEGSDVAPRGNRNILRHLVQVIDCFLRGWDSSVDSGLSMDLGGSKS